jgi:hypothetical protein
VPKTLGLIYFSGLFRNQSSIKELDLLDKIGEGFFMVKKEKKKVGMDLHLVKITLSRETNDFLG